MKRNNNNREGVDGRSGVGGGVQVHLQKFWFVKNLGKIPEYPGKIPENPDKNGAQRLQKNKLWPFFGVHSKKILIIFVADIFLAKVAQLFWQVWEISGKNPSHPQKFVCSYPFER